MWCVHVHHGLLLSFLLLFSVHHVCMQKKFFLFELAAACEQQNIKKCKREVMFRIRMSEAENQSSSKDTLS